MRCSFILFPGAALAGVVMDEKRFQYVSWCDLNILAIKIMSNYNWARKGMLLLENERHCNPDTPVVSLYLLTQEELNAVEDLRVSTYREKIVQSGFYIGHHFGEKSFLKILDTERIIICSDNAERLIWSVIIKYLLTVYADRQDMLHLKAAALEYGNRSFLVTGRGGGGKTKFVETLCGRYSDMDILSNTHTLVDPSNHAIGVMGNVRIHLQSGDQYVAPRSLCQRISEGRPIAAAIFWIQHNTGQSCKITRVDPECAFSNLIRFSAAIGNWELKEDIADLSGDFFQMAGFFRREETRMRSLIESVPVFYLNTDITNDAVQTGIRDLMENILGELDAG